jgi:phosphoglycerate dehydrogenase-like enzyme
MTKAAFFGNAPQQLERVYGGGRKEWLLAEMDFYPEVVSLFDFGEHAEELGEVEFIFSTWGMPPLSEDEIAQLPALRAVFYAAGSVQYFARPFLKRGVKVISAWGANALPVAQFVVAQITLAAKGYFSAERLCRKADGRDSYENHYPGLFGTTISLLGAGMIGTMVIEMLKPYKLELLVFDPFMNLERAVNLCVKKVGLEEAFERGFVVSNHIANLQETTRMIRRGLFELMQPYATFINTGRGATVDEAGMLEVLAKRQDLTALLDVTDPEPPLPDSPIYRLENVLLSPHIAGSIDSEVLRQADYVIEEYKRFKRGEPLLYSVSLEMLKTMA